MRTYINPKKKRSTTKWQRNIYFIIVKLIWCVKQISSRKHTYVSAVQKLLTFFQQKISEYLRIT